jgi:hemerythrin-like domain-containing protein
MDDTLQLINQLIAEHKKISRRTESIEKAANDTSLMSDLKAAGDTAASGVSSGNLPELRKMLEVIDAWLEKHFKREETILLPAVEKQGNEKFVTALNSILFEHSELRDRMSRSRRRIAELLIGGIDPELWNAGVRDMQLQINHSYKLLRTHAEKENHFLTELRRHLRKAANRKEKK